MSEVSSCRERLGKYCSSVEGIDIGFGGDPIVPYAICIDRPSNHPGRAWVGDVITQLEGDAQNLRWFADNSLAWVFSSHCLEDFQDTVGVLREWLRVIQPGGYLVLFLPDQKAYLNHCRENCVLPNQAHFHIHFSLTYVKDCLYQLGISQQDIVHELWPVDNNPYSFDLVVKKPTTL